MDFQTAFAQMKADPQYQKLSYGEQQQVVAGVLQSYLAKDPEFLALNPQDKQAALQSIWKNTVIGLKPVSPNFDGTLTDEERQAFAAGQTPPSEQADMKRALWLAERLDNGDASAQKEATAWIVKNRALTESLVAKAALAGKDAVEKLFNPDAQVFNEIPFHTHDYAKLSEMLASKMSKNAAQDAQEYAALTGLGVGMAENIALTALVGGMGPGSGLLLKGVWKNVGELAAEKGISQTAQAFYGHALPQMISSGMQGVVDVARSFPRLVEEGQLYGPSKFWGGVASSFGQGVAYDLAGQLFRDAWNIAIKPLRTVLFKTPTMKSVDDAKAIADTLEKATDPQTSIRIFHSFADGSIPQEVFDSASKEQQKEIVDAIAKGYTYTHLNPYDPASADGFKILAKSAGFDTKLIPDANGGVKAVQLVQDGVNVGKPFDNFAEAFSFIKANLPKRLDTLDDVIRGWNEEVKVTRLFTSNLSLDDLPVAHVATMAQNVIANTESYEPEALAKLAKSMIGQTGSKLSFEGIVPEEEFANQYAQGAFKQGKLFIPEEITTPQTQEMVKNLLDNIAKPANVFPEANLDAVEAAVKNIDPAGKFEMTPDKKYVLTLRGKPIQLESLDDASSVLWDSMYVEGKIGLNEVSDALNRQAGLILKVEKNPVTEETAYILRNRNGRIVGSYNTLDDVIFSGNLKALPTNLLPPTIVDANGRIVFTNTMVSGTPAQMLSAIKDFSQPDIPVGKVFKQTLSDGTVVKAHAVDNGRYVIDIPSLNDTQVFETFDEMKQALLRMSRAGQEAEKAAARKGIRLSPAPGGMMAASDGQHTWLLRSQEELQGLLFMIPNNPGVDDLLKLSNGGVDDPMQKTVAEIASQMKFEPSKVNPLIDPDTGKAITDGAKILQRTKLSEYIDYYIMPRTNYIMKSIDNGGPKELSPIIQDIKVGTRLFERQKQRMTELLGQIYSDENGHLMGPEQLKLYGWLAQVPEADWAKSAKTYMADPEFELTPLDISKLRATKNLIGALGREFGIDLTGFFENTVPHFRNVNNVSELVALTGASIDEKMARLFPNLSPDAEGYKFISRNLRMDAFLNAHNDHNIYSMLNYYIDKGFRERFVGSPLNRLATWMTENAANPAISDNLKQSLTGYYSILMAIPDTTTQEFANLSLKVSTMTANAMKRAVGFFGDGKLSQQLQESFNNVPTTDITGSISNVMTEAVLGFRPMAGWRNSLQAYTNVYPVFRQHFLKAVNDYSVNKIEEFIQRGLLTDRLWTDLAEVTGNSGVKFTEKLMRFQQTSELYSRIITGMSSDNAFDTALEQLKAGHLGDVSQFRDIARLNYLRDSEFEPIWKLVQEGKTDAARNLAAATNISILMGDFSRENRARISTGFFGRMFGKFGVYNINQIDLYRRFMSVGPLSDRLMTAARLAFVFTSLDMGFKALGMNFSGFNLIDSMSFNGGPLWSTMFDVTQALGSGPQSDMAKVNLWRNFGWWVPGRGFNIPRLLMPGGVQLDYMVKGIRDNNFVEFLGAPMLKEPFSPDFNPLFSTK